MPSTLLGQPASTQKVFQSQTISRDALGMIRMTETYTIRASALASTLPVRGTLHSSWSTATPAYTRMTVEESGYTLRQGDLADLSVTFTGLLTVSGLPAPMVRYVPGQVDAPTRVEIRFVQPFQNAVLYSVGALAPATIAGYPIPRGLPSGPSQDWSVRNTTAAATTINRSPMLIEAFDMEQQGLFAVCRVLVGQSVLVVPVVSTRRVNDGGLPAGGAAVGVIPGGYTGKLFTGSGGAV
jgi:hypothetical protein